MKKYIRVPGFETYVFSEKSEEHGWDPHKGRKSDSLGGSWISSNKKEEETRKESNRKGKACKASRSENVGNVNLLKKKIDNNVL